MGNNPCLSEAYCSTSIAEPGDQRLRTALFDEGKTLLFASDHQANSHHLKVVIIDDLGFTHKRIAIEHEFYPLASKRLGSKYILAGYTMRGDSSFPTLVSLNRINLDLKVAVIDDYEGVLNGIEADRSGLEFLAVGWVRKSQTKDYLWVLGSYQLNISGIYPESIDEEEVYMDVVQGEDGWYILGHQNLGANRDLSLTKLDPLLQQVWRKTYGSTEYEEAQNLVLTSQNKIVIAAHSAEKDPMHQALQMSLDYQGNIEWEKHSGDAMHEGCEAVIETQDANLAFAIRTESHSETSDIQFVIRNRLGELISEELIIEDGINDAYHIIERSNDYLLIGRQIEVGTADDNLYIVKVPK